MCLTSFPVYLFLPSPGAREKPGNEDVDFFKMSNPNQAFANMTMNVRQELCAVMVFAVVDKAGSIVMENEEEVGFDSGFFCAFVKLH